MTGRPAAALRPLRPPARGGAGGAALAFAAAAKAAGSQRLSAIASREAAAPLAIGVVSTLGDAGRAGEFDHHSRLARPEQAEAEPFDDRLGAIARPADRRVDLETDFSHVDDDAVGIDQRARIGGNRTGEIEDQLGRLAVVGEPRRDRDRRRLVGERRRGSRQARREPAVARAKAANFVAIGRIGPRQSARHS